jgi:hypothetical protein
MGGPSFQDVPFGAVFEISRFRDFLRGRLDAEAQAFCAARMRRWQLYNAVAMAILGITLDLIGFFLAAYLVELPAEFDLAVPYVAGSLACLSFWNFVLRTREQGEKTLPFGVNALLVGVGFAQVGKAILVAPDGGTTLLQGGILLQGVLSHGVLIFFPSYHPGRNALLGAFLLGCTAWMWQGQPEFAKALALSIGTVVGVLFVKAAFWSRMLRDAYRHYIEEKRIKEAEKALMQRELELARRIQDSFRPASNMQWRGRNIRCFTHKHSEVGGDWAAMQVDGSGALTMVVVDAAGKGFQAALVVHAVQSLWAEHVSEVRVFDARQWLERVNHSLVIMGRHEIHMVTMGIVRLEGERGIYWSAGHVPLCLIDERRSPKVQTINACGNPLGLYEGVDWLPSGFQLEAGTCLMFGSDGIFHKGTRHKHAEILQFYEHARSDAHDRLVATPVQDDKTLILVGEVAEAAASSSERPRSTRQSA